MPYLPPLSDAYEIQSVIGIAIIYSCYFYNATSYQSNEANLLHANYVPGLQLARDERRAVKALDDAQLNQYIEQYNTLRKDYQKNMRLVKKSKLLKGARSTYEIWIKISNCAIPRPEKYLQNQKSADRTGTTNAFAPTMHNYNRLLKQYERDSIDARYYQLHRQLVFQKYNKNKSK